ncbi:MAG TPA: glycosyltransferase, partial [Pyrinomonadaceae bacterium]|nr:glycosyltransferase [Pyrinomonadaceae bacterium]
LPRRRKSKESRLSTQSPQAKPFAAQMSEWLKERFYESRALQYPYASWMDLQSRAALFRGRSYEATSRLLHLWKQMGTDRFGAERKARLMELVRANCYRGDELLPAAENRLRLEFIRSPEAKEVRKIYGSFAPEHHVRLRFPNDDDPERQGDLMILKTYDAATGERGVLLVKYSEAILAMAAAYDLGALASRYMLIIEPSWWGYQDARFFLYLGSDLDVLVQSPRRADFEFIEELHTNLVPARVGAGEWSDPTIFRPREAGKEATYDIVMVAAWDPFKRHEVFFRAASQLKRQHGRKLRIALIGYELTWTRAEIERLLNQFDLQGDCTIYEDIPHEEVARVVSDSKASLLLSQREGANKALYESMFCGTPAIVYRHQCGVNLDHVNASTGMLADDDELADAIVHVLDHHDDFDPRGWAMEHAGYSNATRKINATLSEIANRRGLPWTRDIVAKKNAPNLRYAESGVYQQFQGEYERLKGYLLPLD